MDDGALIGDGAVGPNEGIPSDGVPENLNPEGIGNDLLGVTVEVRVDEGDVVVGGDNVPEGGETLLNALDNNLVGKGVPEVHQLLVAGGRGHEEALPVAGGETPDNTAPADGRGDNGDVPPKLGLEGVAELVAAVGGDDAVAVGESGEYADVVAVFVLYADRHVLLLLLLFRVCVCVSVCV